ncbi:MAG: TonB-dependent receptor [Pirellulales bacterium]|nr:TonB-dependent receptor [Pirellulales bacterium]
MTARGRTLRRRMVAGYWLIASLAWGTTADVRARTPAPAVEKSTGQPAAQPGLDPGDLDSLLEAAEKDVVQLAQVNVGGMAGQPELGATVSSVGRQDSTVAQSPAAVFVITSEMIRRSGAHNVPDLLRMVPGLDVARIESDSWSITSRGFAGHFANKLLVMIDGRTVYTPLFAGVYWDVQDLLLEDVERIEVVRGPGGTLWGANAVNGVISIVTKKAKDTQGALVTYGGGSEDLALGGVRYGGTNGQGMSWRVYGKHFERGPGYDPAGAHDDWRMGRGGFRLDWELDRRRDDVLTVQGDYYGGQEGHKMLLPVLNDPPDYDRTLIDAEGVSGAHVLGRWTHKIDEDSDWTFLTYFDRAMRWDDLTSQQIDTFDAEFQHRFPLGPRNEVIWGLDYRLVEDRFRTDGFIWNVAPDGRSMGFFGGFVQDEFTLVEDRLSLTLGCKLDDNYYTGFEYQPSARILWTPSPKQSVWAAVSRAVRTPDRMQWDSWSTKPAWWRLGQDVYFPRITGNRDTFSEDLVSYELGYRALVTDRFSIDVATFYNVYDNLIDWRYDWPIPVGDHQYLAPVVFENNAAAQTHGVELWGHWTVRDDWRVSASYSFLDIDYDYEAFFFSLLDPSMKSPRNQARLYSSWDLGRNWEFDLGLRYVDSLSRGIPRYITMDARLAWNPNKHLELALVGRNLLDDHHPEYTEFRYPPEATEVQRGVFAKATWRY